MIIFGHVVDWWASYGGRAIEIQRFARHSVSLCASSSGSERNWITFEFVSYLLPSPSLPFVFTSPSLFDGSAVYISAS